MISIIYKQATNTGKRLLILTLLFISSITLFPALSNASTSNLNNNQSSEIILKQATPQTIRYGKRTPVTVKLETKNLELIRPYLAVGGPGVSTYLESVTPDNAHIILAGIIANTLFAYTTDKQILRIETKTGTPVRSGINNIKFPIDNIFTSQNMLWISQNNLLYELNQQNLTINNTIETKNNITDVQADRHNIYILTDKPAIEIYKRNRIDEPDLITDIKLNSQAKALAINNKIIFIATATGITAIDNREAPTRQSTFTTSGSPNKIIIDNNLAYIADGSRGLTVIDINNHQKMQLIGSYNKLGNVENIAIRGKRLFATNTQGQLYLLDISNPVKPVVRSSFNTHTKIKGINITGSHALVNHADHLTSVNFISETMPPISTEGVTLGGSRRGQIVNNLLYVADWFSGLHIYDISNPGNIKHVSNYHTPGSSKGVLIHKGIAFVGDDDHGLQIIDVSDVKNPKLISELATTGLAYTMKLINNILYLADHRGGFHIIDVSDIKHPVRLGGIDTPGKAWAIDVYKGRAYVADDTTGLLVFDVTTPSKPRLVGQFNPGGFAEDIKVRNGFAYVAFFDKGLYILGLDSPDKPELLGHLTIPGNARGIELDSNDKDYAYISSWYAGLQIVNIKNKKQPVITGHYDTDGATWGTVQKDETIFALDWWEGIKSIDIKDKQKPFYISRYQAKETITDLAIKGNYIFTTNKQSGLQVHDIRNPLNPMWITGLEIPGSSDSISINNNLAFINTGDSIAIINIENPFRIKQITEIKSDYTITGLQLANNSIYISDNNNIISTFKLNNRNKPEKIPSISVTNCQQFQINESLLVCANSNRDLSFYRINNRQKSVSLIKKLSTTSAINLLRINKDNIFLYSKTNKQLTILKNNDSFNRRFTTTLTEHPLELHSYGNMLYISTNKAGLQSYLIDDDKLVEKAKYLANQVISSFVKNKDQIFFGGSRKLSSLDLLPDITNIEINKDQLSFDIPADMPLGSYSLHLSHPKKGHQQFPNLFQVEFPKFRQPQFK